MVDTVSARSVKASYATSTTGSDTSARPANGPRVWTDDERAIFYKMAEKAPVFDLTSASVA